MGSLRHYLDHNSEKHRDDILKAIHERPLSFAAKFAAAVFANSFSHIHPVAFTLATLTDAQISLKYEYFCLASVLSLLSF